MSLISDSAHMVFDALALAVGLWASFMASQPPDKSNPYGYHRYQVLAGFINGIFLLFIAFHIIVECTERIYSPPKVLFEKMFVVGLIGFGMNVIGIFFFHEHAHLHDGDHGHHHHHHHHHDTPATATPTSGNLLIVADHSGNDGIMGSFGNKAESVKHKKDKHSGHDHHHLNGHSHDHHECLTDHGNHKKSHKHHDHHQKNDDSSFIYVSKEPHHDHHHDDDHDHGHSHKHHDHKHGHSHDHSHEHEYEHNHGHSHAHDEHDHHHHHHGHSHGHNENLHGLLLHVAADALGSVGVIVSSILIYYFELYVADSICSVITSLLIFLSVIPLLKSSGRILLQTYPAALEEPIQRCIFEIEQIPGVVRCLKYRVWSYTHDNIKTSLWLQVDANLSPNNKAIIKACKKKFYAISPKFKDIYVQLQN